MKSKKDPFKDLLIEDDASKYLDSLSPEQRRPQFVKNKLPRSRRPFTNEEREAARVAYTPHLRRKA